MTATCLIIPVKSLRAAKRRLAPVLAPGDRRQLVLAMLGDVLAAAAAVLALSDELKSALLAAVSHDLRTPLAAIKASVTSLLDNSVYFAHWQFLPWGSNF